MQRVDPFIPVVVAKHTVRQRAVSIVRRRTFDDVLVRSERKMLTHGTRLYSVMTTRQPAQQLSAGEATMLAPSRVQSQQHSQIFQTQLVHPAPKQTANAVPRATKKGRRLMRMLQPLLIIFGAITVGFLVQSLQIGEIAIVLYGIFALVRRIESRTTFTLALFSLLGIIMLLIIRPNNQLAANFAVYTFLLLVVGTVTLGREIHAANA